MKDAWNRGELEQLSGAELIDIVLRLQHNRPQPPPAKPTAPIPSFAAAPNTGGGLARANGARPGDTMFNCREALAEQKRRTTVLTKLAVELNESLDVDTLVERILRVIAGTLQLTGVNLLLVQPDGSLDLASQAEGGNVGAINRSLAQAMLEHGLAGWVIRQQENAVLSDIAQDSRWSGSPGMPAEGSVMVFAVRQAHLALGALMVYHPEPFHFKPEDVFLMRGIVAQVSTALGAMQRQQSEQRRREQAFALLSTSQFLAADHSPEELAHMVQEKSMSVLGVDYGLLFLLNDKDNRLELVGNLDDLSPNNRSRLRQRAHAVAVQAWKQGRIVPASDTLNGLALDYVALPLLHQGGIIGVLLFVSTSGRGINLSASAWSLLTIFTNLVAAACTSMHLVQRLRVYSEKLEGEVQQRTRQLQTSRDTLRVLFDNFAEGLVLIDTNEQILAANTVFCAQVVGQHPRHVVGRGYDTIWYELEQRGEVQMERQPSPPPSGSGKPAPQVVQVRCIGIEGTICQYHVTRDFVLNTDGDIEHYIERWHALHSIPVA